MRSKKVCHICGKEQKFSFRKDKRVSLVEIDGHHFCSEDCCVKYFNEMSTVELLRRHKLGLI